MDLLDIPDRISTIWASGVSSPYVNPIPETPSGDPGRAAFTTGWPALNFQSVSSGGVPPFGGDFNGITQLLTAQMQWLQAGKLATYDGTFSTSIGGYPKGAIVESVTAPGTYWQSIVDDNTSNPDTGGANWKAWPSGTYFAVDTGTANAGSITLSPAVDDTDKLLGIPIVVIKGAAANLGGTYTMTVNSVSGTLGTYNVVNSNGNVLLRNQLQAGGVFILFWNTVGFTLVGGTPSLSSNSVGGVAMAMVGSLPVGNAPVNILAVNASPGSTTYTVPDDKFWLYGECTGGGGGGAGENTGSSFTGGGGGAGGTAAGWFGVTPGQVINLVIGAGGAGGIAGTGAATTGANGGSSTLGPFMSATGGIGGQSVSNAAGGEGGLGSLTGSGATLYGGYGTDGDIAGTGAFAGNGGASFWGGGTRGARGGPVAGTAAPGSGGGGGYIAGAGGAGMPGLIIIRG